MNKFEIYLLFYFFVHLDFFTDINICIADKYLLNILLKNLLLLIYIKLKEKKKIKATKKEDFLKRGIQTE